MLIYYAKQIKQKQEQDKFDDISSDTTLTKVYNLQADLSTVNSDTVRTATNKNNLQKIKLNFSELKRIFL